MGIPQTPGLTLEQIASCNRFSRKLWGEPMFTPDSHNGVHGWNCLQCSAVMARKITERAKSPSPQPWESRIAA